MTFQELAAEVVRLPLAQRLAVLELVTRSLKEELVRPSDKAFLSARLRGIAKPDGPPPTGEEIQEGYTSFLEQKYS